MAAMWMRVLTQQQHADAGRRRRFNAAYHGGLDADDVWWWLANPEQAGPSGAVAPAQRLATARGPLYRPAVDDRQRAAYEALEHELRSEWDAALAAAGSIVPDVRGATPAGRRLGRRWWWTAAAAVVVVATAGVVALVAHPPVRAAASPSASATSTLHPTSVIRAARLPISLTETLTLLQQAEDVVELHPVSQRSLDDLGTRFFDAVPRGQTGTNPDGLADTDQYRDGGMTVGLQNPPGSTATFRSSGLVGGRLLVGVMLGSASSWQAVVDIEPEAGSGLRDDGPAAGRRSQTVLVTGDPSEGNLQFATVGIPNGDAVTGVTFTVSQPGTQYVWQFEHQVP